jgi:CRISPR type IV-associated protein Csf1
MSRPVSPSKILADAAGIEPVGSHADHEGYCVMCGVGYSTGDLVEQFKATDTFTNWAALSNPSGTHLCGHCAAIKAADYMTAFQCLVASEEGVFRALSNDELASIILDPPKPPFIVHIGMVGKTSHITWRTPVSLSRDVFMIRDGELTVRVNRRRVLEALEDDKTLQSLFATYQAEQVETGAKKRPRASKTPKRGTSALVLTPSFGNAANGSIRYEYLKFAREKSEAGDNLPSEIIARLRSLSTGDVWALHRLVFAVSPARGAKIATPELA